MAWAEEAEGRKWEMGGWTEPGGLGRREATMSRGVRATPAWNLDGKTVGQNLVEQVERMRLEAGLRLRPEQRSALGQFMTPPHVARLMASMFEVERSAVRLLDAGAGVGSLTAAWVAEICGRRKRPTKVSVTAFEVDPLLASYLRRTLKLCGEACAQVGIELSGTVEERDFIEAGVERVRGDLFTPPEPAFDCAILNPPYKKIGTGSRTRELLESIQAGSSNLYTGFLTLSVRLLGEGGELVAITPRSFCNGTYFKPFRQEFLRAMALRGLHVFEARDRAFSEDEVLQENLIVHAIKSRGRAERVLLSSSSGADTEDMSQREVGYAQVVHPGDGEQFIRFALDGVADQVTRRMGSLRCTLGEVGLTVSTGRVVDFRVRELLREEPGEGTHPLIYPGHLSEGYVRWPRKPFRKPNALKASEADEALVVPSAMYVLVKRFSSKEEKRRVVAAVFDPKRVPGERVGFENHLNYYHERGGGLSERVAKGLAVFLNSTLVDASFRQWSGHTQVNAGDLRSMRYPSREQLEELGARVGEAFPGQEEVDALMNQVLFKTGEEGATEMDPIRVKARVNQVVDILRELGMPREQLNERSALVLLALLDMKPGTPWRKASAPLRGITPMMDFFREHYGKEYAPNTRETVRRQTVHQFLDAGFIVANLDLPTRPTNSPKAVYQIEAKALELLRSYGTAAWPKKLEKYLKVAGSLSERYAREREMRLLPLRLDGGRTVALSPGGQNELVREIIEKFCPRFTPGGRPLYIGDTEHKWAYFDEEALSELGVRIESHGKMPDVVVYHEEKNWLVLIEAVTSHGPVNAKRHGELKKLFGGANAGLVFVTAFMTRQVMVKYLGELSWETEVWVAQSPSHMIHFDGERFLGPYPD